MTARGHRWPLVGVTCYVERARWTVWEAEAALIPKTYLAAIERAGGRPLIVPPSDTVSVDVLDVLDGIVFSGGADIDPALYGAERHAETGPACTDRDSSELALMKEALSRNVPLLGICRGMQLLNVVTGGNLVQHIEDDPLLGEHRKAPGEFARHGVRCAEDSRLCRILGERAEVPSHHHQAIGRLGGRLRAVAWAADGSVEGIEDPSRPFAIGILWHPEESDDDALFDALVDAAGSHHSGVHRFAQTGAGS